MGHCVGVFRFKHHSSYVALSHCGSSLSQVSQRLCCVESLWGAFCLRHHSGYIALGHCVGVFCLTHHSSYVAWGYGVGGVCLWRQALCAAQVACVQPSAHAGSKRAFTMRVLPRRCLTTSSLLSSTSAALFGLSSPRRLPPLPPWCWAAPATAAPTCGKSPVCLCARVIRSIDSKMASSTASRWWAKATRAAVFPRRKTMAPVIGGPST